LAPMRIDRLSLQIPGVSEAKGRELGLLLADKLAAAGGLPAIGDMPRLRIDVIADPLSSPDQLIDRIVAEVMAQLRRVP
jgi:hypothetical protein